MHAGLHTVQMTKFDAWQEVVRKQVSMYLRPFALMLAGLHTVQVIQFDTRQEVVRKQVSMELRTLAEANHPSIVKFYQSFLNDGAVVIVMEHMDAGSMADVLQRHRNISEPYLAQMALQASITNCSPMKVVNPLFWELFSNDIAISLSLTWPRLPSRQALQTAPQSQWAIRCLGSCSPATLQHL